MICETVHALTSPDTTYIELFLPRRQAVCPRFLLLFDIQSGADYFRYSMASFRFASNTKI